MWRRDRSSKRLSEAAQESDTPTAAGERSSRYVARVNGQGAPTHLRPVADSDWQVDRRQAEGAALTSLEGHRELNGVARAEAGHLQRQVGLTNSQPEASCHTKCVHCAECDSPGMYQQRTTRDTTTQEYKLGCSRGRSARGALKQNMLAMPTTHVGATHLAWLHVEARGHGDVLVQLKRRRQRARVRHLERLALYAAHKHVPKVANKGADDVLGRQQWGGGTTPSAGTGASTAVHATEAGR